MTHENVWTLRHTGAPGAFDMDRRLEAMDLMGDKLSARAAMKKAGVPIVPGSEGALTKGPFNALPPIIDLNNALVSFVLTGHHTFVTAAGATAGYFAGRLVKA